MGESANSDIRAVKIVECPRDAWQGLSQVIPTEAKAVYLRKLIEAGFRHIDAVSFVPPKHVPQMADSEEVMRQILDGGLLSPRPEIPAPGAEIIGLVVNEQGLDRALATPGVSTLGYPYSISANFRRQNANMSLSQSRALVKKLQGSCAAAGRKLAVYISMAFGNPFDEPWGPEIVEETVLWLKGVGVQTISLADTVGTASPKEVGDLFRAVQASAKGVELGVHLHSRPEEAAEKIQAAYEAGCGRFDCTLTGLGGCPFAGDDLVGNIATEVVIGTLQPRGATTGIEPWALLKAVEATSDLRKEYAR